MIEMLKTLVVCIRKCIEMIWNYFEIKRLVSLYVSLYTVFQNLVTLIITNGETT